MDILSYRMGQSSAGGGGEAVLINKDISTNGTYNASSDSADGYKKVVVDVPNTYAAGDEGKVVSNGALVSQTSETITASGTYDTTLINEAVVDISGYSVDDWFNGIVPVGEVSFKAKNNLPSRAIAGRTYLTKITADLSDGYTLTGWTVQACPALTTVVFIFPKTEEMNFYLPGNVIYDSPNIKTVVVRGKIKGTNNQCLMGHQKLTVFDAEYFSTRIDQNTFNNCKVLTDVVLRQTEMVAPLTNISAFNGSPFASGGTGGTLYVPQALISSYQGATNWSTILGYANNQIKKIEGTIYETQYADGTPIT